MAVLAVSPMGFLNKSDTRRSTASLWESSNLTVSEPMEEDLAWVVMEVVSVDMEVVWVDMEVVWVVMEVALSEYLS